MNDILQPIKFYDSSAYTLYQKQQKNGYNYLPSLLIDRTSLLPFQLTRTKNIVPNDQSASYQQIDVTTLNLVNVRTNVAIDLLQYIDLQYYVYNDWEDIEGSSLLGTVTDVAVYEGGGTIPTIEHGKYYIYAQDANSNEWYSCYLVSKTPSRSVSLEYRSSTPNNYLISSSRFYWKMIFEIYTHDPGEWDETVETLIDSVGEEYDGFIREDKLWACEFLSDSCTHDALLFMAKFCDVVHITDETGKEEIIEVKSISHDPQGHSNHFQTVLKYVIPENQLLSTNTDTFTRYAEKKAGGVIGEVSKLLSTRDLKIKTHGRFIKRR